MVFNQDMTTRINTITDCLKITVAGNKENTISNNTESKSRISHKSKFRQTKKIGDLVEEGPCPITKVLNKGAIKI